MKIAEIEKMCEDASPEPWEVDGQSGAGETPDGRIIFSIKSNHVNPWVAMDTDPRFVRASRYLLPKFVKFFKAYQAYKKEPTEEAYLELDRLEIEVESEE